MKTVFSHIVQKRLSQENENVATEALAYMVNSSEGAHRGMMNLLKTLSDIFKSAERDDG
jgi:replication-associated recombination protein RarA